MTIYIYIYIVILLYCFIIILLYIYILFIYMYIYIYNIYFIYIYIYNFSFIYLFIYIYILFIYLHKYIIYIYIYISLYIIYLFIYIFWDQSSFCSFLASAREWRQLAARGPFVRAAAPSQEVPPAPAVFVLSLARRVDRRESIGSTLSSLAAPFSNFTFVDAVDGKLLSERRGSNAILVEGTASTWRCAWRHVAEDPPWVLQNRRTQSSGGGSSANISFGWIGKGQFLKFGISSLAPWATKKWRGVLPLVTRLVLISSKTTLCFQKAGVVWSISLIE